MIFALKSFMEKLVLQGVKNLSGYYLHMVARCV